MKLRKYLPFLLFLPALVVFTAAKPNSGKDDKPSLSVTKFLEWYKQNQKRLNQINLVAGYKNGTGATGSNYSVDYKTVEQYLTEIKKSTYIGPKYVEKWRARFKKAEEDFKNNPQNSGPPRGFEYDLVMLAPVRMDQPGGQDADSDLANIDKAEVKSEVIESNNYALVMIKFASGRIIKYELAKQNNKWLINDISI